MRRMLLTASLCTMWFVVGCAEPETPVATTAPETTTSTDPGEETMAKSHLDKVDADGLDKMIGSGVSVVEFSAVW